MMSKAYDRHMFHVNVTFYVTVLVLALGLLPQIGHGFRTKDGKDCTPNDMHGCSCKFTDGSGIVDLTSLGTSDDTPRFKDVKEQNGENTFSYSPCYGFREGEGKCTEAAMCLTTDQTQTIKLGDAGNAMFAYDEESGNVVAGYTTQSSVLMVSEVTLNCDPKACIPVLTAEGQASVGNYKFTLTSVCACAGMCSADGPKATCGASSGTSGVALGVGYIILITFAVLVVVYLSVGASVTKIRRQGATGTDVIPHKAFWVSLPGLIKSGALFTYGVCRGRRSEYIKK